MGTCPSRMPWISALDRGSCAFPGRRCAMPGLLGSLRDLPQQCEHRHQARFGAYELPLIEAREPVDCAFGGGRQIVVRLIAARRIVFAQPTLAVGRPIVQVLFGAPGEGLLAQLFAQAVEVIGQARCQFRLRHGADVRLNECLMQEADDHRGVVGNQQAPRRIRFPELVKGTIIHREAGFFLNCSPERKFCEPRPSFVRSPCEANP